MTSCWSVFSDFKLPEGLRFLSSIWYKWPLPSSWNTLISGLQLYYFVLVFPPPHQPFLLGLLYWPSHQPLNIECLKDWTWILFFYLSISPSLSLMISFSSVVLNIDRLTIALGYLRDVTYIHGRRGLVFSPSPSWNPLSSLSFQSL